jgi:hypothetical protein
MVHQPIYFSQSSVIFFSEFCHSACSLEIISQISQPANNVFISQKISQQYFQPVRSAQANMLSVFAVR